MKIRCGSHQQNRSIVRPGLSLMATKVALTAEEFRENSQRSIALFNTEKLSTDSTHVLKSAYCNSVHFCRCNLHGACGGKGLTDFLLRGHIGLQSARSVWRQRKSPYITSFCPGRCNLHGACGGKVFSLNHSSVKTALQSARSVWRQSSLYQTNTTAGVLLQSARSVWRQSCPAPYDCMALDVAICTERVEAKACNVDPIAHANRCNLHGACGGKGRGASSAPWSAFRCNLHGACGGKASSLGGNSESHVGCNLHGACGGKGRTDSTAARGLCCNLHGACGGKG